jgi:DNA-binding CsgD family transcriptional regulator
MRIIKINPDKFESEPNSKATSRPSTVYADRIDLLRTRVDILTGRDKALMTMYLDNGSTFRQMARIAGVNESSIARKIHRLTRRLLNAGYITCLRNRHRLSKIDLLVARDYFIEGISQQNIARKRKITVYAVRKALRNIQKLTRTTNENSI